MMTELDILVFIICVAAFIRGCFTGLIMQVATLGGIVLGILFAGTLSPLISPYIAKTVNQIPEIDLATPISYLICFIAILIIVTIIGRVINYSIEAVLLGPANRIAGGFFCMLKWILICCVALNLIVSFDAEKSIVTKSMRNESLCYKVMTEIGKTIMPFLDVEQYNEFLPESGKVRILP